MKITKSTIDRYIYSIEECILISFKTKRIVLLGISERKAYGILKEAWKVNQDFRKWEFPLRAHRDEKEDAHTALYRGNPNLYRAYKLLNKLGVTTTLQGKVYIERKNEWEMI